MAKRPRPKPTAASSARPAPPPPPPRHAVAWPLVQTAGRAAAALFIVFGIMFAIVYLAGQAGRVVTPQDRYTQDFDAIECEAPPGMDKRLFLLEVRARCDPDLRAHFQVVSPQLKPYLKAAFERHEWVRSVESVEVRPTGRVVVRLEFRKPALAVAILGRAEPVVVDREAVILPPGTSAAGLAVFVTPQPPPQQRGGEQWDSKAVRRAVDTATHYNLETIRLERGWWKVVIDGKPKEWPDG